MTYPLSLKQAILKEKCPRCREGDLFKQPVLSIGFYKMYNRCSSCNQTFEPEPGFYFGAMFISYAMAVAMSVISWIVLYFMLNPPFATYVIVILIVNVVLLPFIFRLSRTLFLYGFGGIKYKSN